MRKKLDQRLVLSLTIIHRPLNSWQQTSAICIHTHIYVIMYTNISTQTDTHTCAYFCLCVRVHRPSSSKSFSIKQLEDRSSSVILSTLVNHKDQRNMNVINCGPGMYVFLEYILMVHFMWNVELISSSIIKWHETWGVHSEVWDRWNSFMNMPLAL